METSKIHVEDMDGAGLENRWNGLASTNHGRYTPTYHNTLLQEKSCTYLIHPVHYHPTQKKWCSVRLTGMVGEVTLKWSRQGWQAAAAGAVFPSEGDPLAKAQPLVVVPPSQ